jgi:hypothetical protein
MRKVIAESLASNLGRIEAAPGMKIKLAERLAADAFALKLNAFLPRARWRAAHFPSPACGEGCRAIRAGHRSSRVGVAFARFPGDTPGGFLDRRHPRGYIPSVLDPAGREPGHNARPRH